MARENLNDLSAFVAVAQAHSFTKAAARLGISPSALSHAMRGLEERLGVRLLARTTRSVAPTEAGERLLTVVLPHLQGIESELSALNLLRDVPAGTIRLTASEHAAYTVIYPVLARLAADYPEIKIEVNVDNMLADLVAGRFDAGIRLGEHVERDMVAVRIAPDMRMAIVGTPAYFERHPRPETPQDLTQHQCIGIRLPTHGGLLPWEFDKDGRSITVRVEGQLIFNTNSLALRAVLDGLGLGYYLDDMAAEAIADGRLIRVLEDWCEPFPGYHIYYPSRRQISPALRLLIDALRFR
ncbi:DNA-binding transcriptional regulator, LysR family [Bradyrhizobium erythrophlei]|nr:DNA-binding transcriptional regulator, LysR family [Bradyrhizobium erythrophlei]